VSVTRNDVLKIAALAELHVDDATAAELEQQVSRILDHVAQLNEVPTDGAAPEDGRSARLRKDVVTPDPLSAPPSSFAPAFRQGLFTVPRLAELERGEDAP